MTALSDAQACRIDAWLWRARMFKTRAAAGDFVDAGKVRLARGDWVQRVDKRSRKVRPGDTLVFVLSDQVMALRVEALGDRRGPAREARTLYRAEAPPPNAVSA